MIKRQSLITQLENVEIYKKYPTLVPYVGENYTKAKNKLLIIAESHYFPKDSVVNFDTWYNAPYEKASLTDKQWKMITTANVLGKYKKKGNPLSSNIVESLFKVEWENAQDKDDVIRYVAFMNAFQRPAQYKESIKSCKLDIDYAQSTISRVIKILQPNIIAFVSKKAYYKCKSALPLTIPYFAVPHPSCCWWNRIMKKHGSGKEQFEAQLRKVINSPIEHIPVI
ncbi:hypothetical protein [uncultured Gilliamella sp.]|uniref:hypothetical protein n=1 Tax=uncultured Gilliamella sp. TaxID=1193505 RepID=UPI0025D714C5|nr:hypothetical protein [uncultured Gilliamella sp.]